MAQKGGCKMHEIPDFNLELFSLKGRNALVTGGNSGLGQGFSVALAKAGANVLAVSLVEDQAETQKLVEACNVRYKLVIADITKSGECKRVVEECVNTFGSIDILVNCAGRGINIKNVREFGKDSWDKVVALNLSAAFEMTHEAIQYMIVQNRGKIINIGSLFTFLGGQWDPAYAATKHGISGLSKAMCDELAQFNIQVNTIAPGYFATKLTADTRADEKASRTILDHVPANRWGDVYDLMGPCVFLASDASNYVNGTVLTVDGGYLVR
ncbi:MAG: SDR family oxidoreductase [Bacteroidia bacterium]|nr:SDR family oxidoreductase [Bacteroidia bacterium]